MLFFTQFLIRLRVVFSCAGVLFLAGCATFSQDGGFGEVVKTTRQHIPQSLVWANTAEQQAQNKTQVEAMLAEPLCVEDAVQIALLNNAQLQADFYELQIAEADLVQAGRLPNPGFSMLYARNNGDYKIEQVLSFNILALLTLSKATAVEQKRFAATQQAVSARVLALALETRNAYYRALAAKENVRYLSEVKNVAEATATLAQRMRQAGNWNALEQAREQGFYQEAVLELARAENAESQARELLAQKLGLTQSDKLMLPDRLPDLPTSADELKQISSDDFAKRLDLQQMKNRTEALAQQLGLTRATRFVNVLEIGPARVLEGRRGDPVKTGVELRFELPLFDWGAAKVKRAEAQYMQAVHLAANQATAAASQVRAAHQQYQTNFAVAKRYRDEIVPLRQQVLQQNVLRYNGMLIGPFELMADARAQVQSVNAYIQALRDFWLAETSLDAALIGVPLENSGGQP